MSRLAFDSTLRAMAPHVASVGVVQAASSPQATDRPAEATMSAAHGSATADPASVVTVGQARFTVLTPQLVRMEWAADRRFEDRPSLVFVNRRLPVPTFTRTSSGGWTTIDTGRLTLRYRDGSGTFNSKNLSVTLVVAGKPVTWRPGTPDTGNLRGTTRTLDEVKGATSLEPGLVSRDGWVVVDDTRARCSTTPTGPGSWSGRRARRLDWYFFGHGHDYKAALGDFVRVAGRIPMPPRFAFGTWWSRLLGYTDQELKDLVASSRATTSRSTCSSSTWTGTSRSHQLVGERERSGGPLARLDRLHVESRPVPRSWGLPRVVRSHGLKTTLNLHPASGIQPHEKRIPEMARAMGIDPATQKYVPFDITNKQFATNYFDILHRPLERQGVDFWWLDWQQGSTTKIRGVNPTWWLNYVHSSRHGAARAAAAHLPPLGRARESPLPDRVLRRHALGVGVTRVPALLHRDGGQRRLRLLEPRHRRTHAGRRRAPISTRAGSSSACSARSSARTRRRTREPSGASGRIPTSTRR